MSGRLMTKISLFNQEVLLSIYNEGGKEPRKIIIKNGKYNKKQYSSLVLSEGEIILDGNGEMLVLAKGSKTVAIQMTDFVTKLGKQLGSNDIHFDGIHAVPAGKERELLEALIQENH